METGAIVAVTLPGEDEGDTTAATFPSSGAEPICIRRKQLHDRQDACYGPVEVSSAQKGAPMGSSTGGGSTLRFAKAEILAALKAEGITDLDGLATHIESVAKPQGAGSEHRLVATKGWVLHISEK